MSSARGGAARGAARGNNFNARSGPSNPFQSGRGNFTTRASTRGAGSPFRRGNRENGARGGRMAEGKTRAAPPQQQQSTLPASGVPSTKGSWLDRWNALQKAREQETSDARKQGLVADPDNPRSLADAITPVGTCQEMCAEYERVQRVVQKDVWAEETDPNESVYSSAHERIPDEARMVKKFRRAAAGLDEQLPSDLRPPAILKRTCDFLFDEVVGNAASLGSVHHFVWDRTRAIRNDFSIQQVTKPEDLSMAIECYERIARFHIVSLHLLAVDPTPYEAYDAQQEREQLDRTLLSLMQYYDDCSGRIHLPNEAEFRAYSIIHQLQGYSPDLEDRVQSWPAPVARNPRVRTALKIFEAAGNTTDAQGPLTPRSNHLIARQDWEQFWTLVASKQVSYLMACVAEIYFNLVRRMLLNALWRGYRSNPKASDKIWTLDTLCDLFAFDDPQDVIKFCQAYEFSFGKTDDGDQYLDLMSVRDRELPAAPKMLRKQTRSELVEGKRLGRTIPAIIKGLTVRDAQKQGLVVAEEIEADMEDATSDGGLQNGDYDQETTEEHDAEAGTSLFMPSKQPSLFAPSSTAAETRAGGNTNPFGMPSASAKPSTSPFGNPSPFLAPFKDASAQNRSPFAPSKPAESPVSPFFKPSTHLPAAEKTELPAAPGVQSKFTFGQPDTKPVTQSTPAEAKELPKFAPSTLFPSAFTPSTFSFNKSSAETKESAGSPSTQSSPGLFVSPVSEAEPPKSNSFFSWQKDAPSATNSAPEQQSSVAFAQPQSSFVPAVKPSEEMQLPAIENLRPTKPTPSLASPAPQPAATAQTPNPPSSNAPASRKASVPQVFQPNKPSPLRNSFSAETAPNGSPVTGSNTDKSSGKLQSQLTGPKAPSQFNAEARPSATDFRLVVSRIADEITFTERWGFLDQYIDFIVGQTITDVQEKIYNEHVTGEADEFRRRTLAMRYGKKWREVAWRRRLAQQGRKRRERAQRRLRESKGLEDDTSVVDTASLRARSRGGPIRESVVSREHEIDRLFQQTIRNSRNASMPEDHRQSVSGSKRRLTSEADETSDVEGKRVKVQQETRKNDVKSEVLKRSSFLGFSLPESARHIRSTTQTDYFRWKALGIDAKSLARGTKRQREDSITTPEKAGPLAKISKPSPETAKKVRSMAPPPPRARSKTNDEDEALFARLKAAREKLSESWSAYTPEIGKNHELARSTGSRSSNDSPSMVAARAEARLRAPGSFNLDASTLNRDVPAYRLRESRFVSREEYTKAIDRANETRASRSRETSRPHSPMNLNGSASAFDERAVRRINKSVESTRNKSPAVQPPVHDSFQSRLAPVQTSQTYAPASYNLEATKTNEHANAQPFAYPYSSEPASEQGSFTHGMPLDGPSRSLGGLASTHVSETQLQQSPFTFGSQASTYQTALSQPEDRDFTVRPDQVEQSLRSSFGTAVHQPDNMLQQSVGLVSSTSAVVAGDAGALPAYPNTYAGDFYDHNGTEDIVGGDTEDDFAGEQHIVNGEAAYIRGDTEHDESEDDCRSQYPAPDVFAQPNPYDALVDQQSGGEDDTEEDDGTEGYTNGYAGEDELNESEEEGVEEDEGEYEDEEGYEDEEDGSEDEEEEYDTHPSFGQPAPSKNPALQIGGNTEEEAIELSD